MRRLFVSGAEVLGGFEEAVFRVIPRPLVGAVLLPLDE
jgi:hypothetical protein